MDPDTVNHGILYIIMPTIPSATQQDQLLDVVFGKKNPILCDFYRRLTHYQSNIY